MKKPPLRMQLQRLHFGNIGYWYCLVSLHLLHMLLHEFVLLEGVTFSFISLRKKSLVVLVMLVALLGASFFSKVMPILPKNLAEVMEMVGASIEIAWLWRVKEGVAWLVE